MNQASTKPKQNSGTAKTPLPPRNAVQPSTSRTTATGLNLFWKTVLAAMLIGATNGCQTRGPEEYAEAAIQSLNAPMTPVNAWTSPLRPEAESFVPGATLVEQVVFRLGGTVTYQRGLPAGWNEAADTRGVFVEMFRQARLVHDYGACALPGVSIVSDLFVETMWAATNEGFISPDTASYVENSLMHGFDCGIARDRLRGQRVFSNYEGALGDAAPAVAKAIHARVQQERTVDYGVWSFDLRAYMARVFGDYAIAPMSSRDKGPLQPGVRRPVTDHTRTGLKAATDQRFFQHTLRAYEEIAECLKLGYTMGVSDVDGAFTLIPLAPWLWPFFFVRFWHYDEGLEGGIDTALPQHLFGASVTSQVISARRACPGLSKWSSWTV